MYPSVMNIHLILHKRPFKLVYNILYSSLEVFNLFYELKIVGLKEAAHTIQLGVFSSVREVRANPYHTILIYIYGFVL